MPRRAKAHVYLRPPTARDRDALIDAYRRSAKLHRPWLSGPRDAAAFARYLKHVRQPTHASFLIRRVEDDAIVGVMNLNEIVRGVFHSAYLGYCAFAPFDGQGYMTEAMALLLRHAFTKMKLHRIEANVQPGNARSIALVKRCGFRLEGYSPRYLKIAGRWRDHERWAITVEDWRRKE